MDGPWPAAVADVLAVVADCCCDGPEEAVVDGETRLEDVEARDR